MNKLLAAIAVLSVVTAPAFAQGYGRQTVHPYKPPPINTFSDRVTNAIHSYPLEKGIGNNPTDQQMYIRQRVN